LTRCSVAPQAGATANTQSPENAVTQTRLLRAAALAPLALATVVLSQPSFEGLGDFPNGLFESSAIAISADGSVIVGAGNSTNGNQAFRWTQPTGMLGLGFINGFGESEAFAVSADGSVIVGYSDSVQGLQAFRWTEAGGMAGIGDISGGLFGSASGAITGDGKMIAGIGDINGGNGTGQAFRWTQAGGIVGLGDIPGGIFSSSATGISADGTVIVGTGDLILFNQGEAFRKIGNGGLVGIGDLAGGTFHSTASATTYNGAVVVGQGHSVHGAVAFRWQGNVMKGLSDLAGGAVDSSATACSADGSVVVGYGTEEGGRRAFIWTEAGGMKNLQALLLSKGVTGLTGWTLTNANSCSADGTIIVGHGTNPDGKQEAFLARLAEACNDGTTRASLGSPGDLQASNGSANGSISQNGQFVAFESTATNLVDNDTNNRKDIFVRNRSANWTTRVSLTHAGFQANNDSWDARINAKDGRYVVFVSSASNLVPGDTNGKPDIFRRDRVNNTTALVSIGLDLQPGNGASGAPQISADGRFIAFQSTARNLTQDENTPFAFNHIFIRDMVSGVTEMVSRNSSGTFANAGSSTPTLSNDGRYIAFASDANNLSLPEVVDTNLTRDIFIRDRFLGKTARASVSSAGGQSNGLSSLPRLSGDGRTVAFTSSATNLIAGDANARDDVFIHDRINRSTLRASMGPNQLAPNAHCFAAAISSNGRFILFNSGSNNLVPHDTNGVSDAFVFDAWTLRTSRVGIGNSDQQPTAACTGTALSASGLAAVFHTISGNMTPPDNAFNDVFVRDICKP
jgi:probable HAF family extracellular repeat protein